MTASVKGVPSTQEIVKLLRDYLYQLDMTVRRDGPENEANYQRVCEAADALEHSVPGEPTEEQVERAAEALWQNHFIPSPGNMQTTFPQPLKQANPQHGAHYRNLATIALTAAFAQPTITRVDLRKALVEKYGALTRATPEAGK